MVSLCYGTIFEVYDLISILEILYNRSLISRNSSHNFFVFIADFLLNCLLLTCNRIFDNSLLDTSIRKNLDNKTLLESKCKTSSFIFLVIVRWAIWNHLTWYGFILHLSLQNRVRIAFNSFSVHWRLQNTPSVSRCQTFSWFKTLSIVGKLLGTLHRIRII
jgi:hypothetical protein